MLDLAQLRAAVEGKPPALASIMLANNETGALQPVREAAGIVHAAGGVLHVDAIQALGKVAFDISALEADLLTLSAHKIGGPKGVGAVVLAEGLQGFEPLLWAGEQYKGVPKRIRIEIGFDPVDLWARMRLTHGAGDCRR